MLCDICKKNPATIHIQEIVNGQKRSLHICASCAASKISGDSTPDEFNLADMLYNISDEFSSHFEYENKMNNEAEPKPAVTCPKCGWDLNRLRQTGRLGCEECYAAFREMLLSALETMHKGTVHVGKKPGVKTDTEISLISLKIMNLQHEMEEYIRREEYEKAAVARDEIKQLKEQLKE